MLYYLSTKLRCGAMQCKVKGSGGGSLSWCEVCRDDVAVVGWLRDLARYVVECIVDPGTVSVLSRSFVVSESFGKRAVGQ